MTESNITRIILVRHGESWANYYGIIVSKPEHGDKAAGLTPYGKEQVKIAARKAIEEGIVDSETVVYSSTLRRCRETAKTIVDEIGIADFSLRSELNERNFGELEFGDHSKYGLIYTKDQYDPNHHKFGVESVNDVRRRVSRLLEDIEEKHTGKTVVLVTHKDISEIIQTTLQGLPPERHRDRTAIPKHQNGAFVKLPLRRNVR